MENRTIAPVKPELIITVVERDEARFYEDLIQSLGANVQMTVDGHGTANEKILRRLGIAETEKAVLFSLVRKDRMETVLATLKEKFRALRGGNGIAMAVPLNSMIGTLLYQLLIDDRSNTGAKPTGSSQGS